MKMEQNVPKRRHIKFRRRGITQKKTYNIQNTAEVRNKKFLLFYQPRLCLPCFLFPGDYPSTSLYAFLISPPVLCLSVCLSVLITSHIHNPPPGTLISQIIPGDFHFRYISPEFRYSSFRGPNMYIPPSNFQVSSAHLSLSLSLSLWGPHPVPDQPTPHPTTPRLWHTF